MQGGVVFEQPNRPRTVPYGEGLCFEIALPVGKLDLQHRLSALGEDDRSYEGDVRVRIRLVQLEIPLG